jgi:hypothetical protein
MERFFKIHVRRLDGDGISVVEPEAYRIRFLRKMVDILGIRIVEDQDPCQTDPENAAPSPNQRKTKHEREEESDFSLIYAPSALQHDEDEYVDNDSAFPVYSDRDFATGELIHL